MDDGDFGGQIAGTARHDDVFALAAAALSVLASRGNGSGKTDPTDLIGELCEACVHASDERRYATISRLIARGVSSEDIVDSYIPLAALRLGESWVNDTRSFAEVSIGAARLQEMVRALARHRSSVAATIPLGHRILIAIPEEEEHTLGAFIAASQFRRYGVWVHLAIGQTADEIAQTVRSQGFDMLGITGAGRKSLAPLRKIVEKVRASVAAVPPIVAGGNVCNLGVDLTESTGVDLATTNPRKAMEFCGMPVKPQRRHAADRVASM